MKRDLLYELYSGITSLAEAEAIYDSIMGGEEAAAVADHLGLTPVEWTAYAHGVGFAELARWRHEGWPSACARCGQTIAVHRYGWLAREEREGVEGAHHLVHVACPATVEE